MAERKVGIELVAEGNDQFLSDVGKSNKAISDLENTADKASSGGFGKLGSAVAGFGKVLGGLALGGAVAGVAGLGAALVNGVADAREANQVMAATENVIRSMGRTGAISADEIAQMAGSLSAAEGKSLFGDSDIQAGQNMLLTFANINEVLPDATQAMVDMTQFMGGDMTSSATMLGKALDNPKEGLSAMSRVGVSFSEQQKEMITTMQDAGDMAGAQGVILEALQSQFGGAALAAAQADGGMAMFKDRMGELAESVGAKVLPMLNSLMGWLNSPEVQAGITALVDGLVNGVTKIGEVIASVTAAFQEGGLAGVFDLVLPKLQEFGAKVLDWIAEQAPAWLEQLATWGAAFAQWVVDALPPLMDELGELWKTLVSWVMDNAPKWAAELLKFGLAAVEWVTDAMGPLVDKLGKFANEMINWVVDQLPGWGKQLAEFGKLAIKWVLDALPGLMENLGTFAGKLIGWILQTAIDVVPKLAEMGVKFVAWVVTDVLPELPGALRKIWDALVIFVQTAAVDIVPKLKEMASKFLTWVDTDVVPFLAGKMDAIKTTIVGWINGALGWAGSALKGMGAAIVQGLIDGINSMIGRAREVLNQLIGIINSIPGIPNLPTFGGKSFGGMSPLGGGTVSPPASATQQMAGGFGNTSNITRVYNYSPSYGSAPRNPSQDFHIMAALAR